MQAERQAGSLLSSRAAHPPLEGAGLGGLAGGMLYGTYGAEALFRTAALALAVGWLAALAVLRACPPSVATGGQGQFCAGAERLAGDLESDGTGEEVALMLAA